MTRQYTKLKGNIDIDLLRQNISSGNFMHSEIQLMFSITERQMWYLIQKYNIENNLITDRAYLQSEAYRNSISISNTGKIRTEEHKYNYRIAASRRLIKNNRGSGYKQTPETIAKITISNNKTYEILPQAWIDSCINNEEWYEKLRDSALHKPPMTEDHIRKMVETKVGLSYDEWQIVKGELDVYRSKVRFITDKQPLFSLINIEKRGSDYHLDHMFSVAEGFKQNVLPEIIGHITNLIIISAHDNCVKNKKCSITLTELYEKYNEMENKAK